MGEPSDYGSDTSTKSETTAKSRVWRDSLLASLDSIKSTGDFAVSNRHSAFPNPGLELDGHGLISLPLTPTDAEAIKAVAKQATYGASDGMENIVDTSVRKTWELQPSQFRLANQAWKPYIDTHILMRAADGLGLQTVTARLHKLLLYDQGSYFKCHKDSDTEAGMLGTLVLCLPSRHKGGDVHLSFKSDKRTLTTDAAPVWDLTALAWFSDVVHEVTELTDGYRLVLTYKLFHEEGPKPSAQFFHEQLEHLKTIVRTYEMTEPVYYPLDHLYSETTWPLSIGSMKGRDRAVCQLLHDACSDSGITALIAPLEHVEDHDDDYGDPGEETTLQRVYTCDGLSLASDLAVNKEDFLTADPFDREPDDETFGGYQVGYDHCQGRSRFNYTVAMLLPWRGLDATVPRLHSHPKKELLLSIVDEQLRRHRDPIIDESAVAVFTSAVGTDGRMYSEPVPLTPLTLQITLHWALKIKNDKLYRTVGVRGLSCLETHETVLDMVGRHLQGLLTQGIEWKTWFECFAEDCDLATWQLVVERFPSHLQPQELQDSFKAWGQARIDTKFESQTRLGDDSDRRGRPEANWGDDCSFLVKMIESRPVGSEWIMTCMLPALASRGSRKLLFSILDTFFTRREEEHFAFAKAAFEYLVQPCRAMLGLRASDLTFGGKLAARFVALLDQCLTLGATEEATTLLEGTSHELEQNPSDYNEYHGNKTFNKKIVPDLLMPLVLLLDRHRYAAHEAKTFFVTVIRRYVLSSLRTSELNWAHDLRRCESLYCDSCDTMGSFLGSAVDRVWRFPAEESSRDHIMSVLSGQDDCFEMTTEVGATLVVIKKGAKPSKRVKQYNDAVESLQSALAPLKGEAMRSLLGVDDYRDIFCLHLTKVQDIGKRKAEEDIKSEAKKSKVAVRGGK